MPEPVQLELADRNYLINKELISAAVAWTTGMILQNCKTFYGAACSSAERPMLRQMGKGALPEIGCQPREEEDTGGAKAESPQ